MRRIEEYLFEEVRGEEETGFLSYGFWAQEHVNVSAFGAGTLWYLCEGF